MATMHARMRPGKTKAETLEILKAAYGWPNAKGLDAIFRKITKADADALQAYLNDAFRKGYAAHEAYAEEVTAIAWDLPQSPRVGDMERARDLIQAPRNKGPGPKGH